LPNIGKNRLTLPNIGKIENRPFAAGAGFLPNLGKNGEILPNIGKIA